MKDQTTITLSADELHMLTLALNTKITEQRGSIDYLPAHSTQAYEALKVTLLGVLTALEEPEAPRGFEPDESSFTLSLRPDGAFIDDMGALSAPLYAEAFPTFVLDVEIPANWIDTSWHNDTCPSWQYGDRKVYVEFADPNDRDFATSCRFFVYEYRGDGPHDDHWADLHRGNDWAEVLRLMANEGDVPAQREELVASLRDALRRGPPETVGYGPEGRVGFQSGWLLAMDTVWVRMASLLPALAEVTEQGYSEEDSFYVHQRG